MPTARIAFDGASPQVPFAIDRWRIDPAAREARTQGGAVRRLSPRALGVLLTLVQAGGDAVSRAALLDAVWPDVNVCDDSLTQAIAELRRTLGKTQDGTSFIETIPKTGYRLAARVRVDAGPLVLAEENTETDFDLDAYALCLEAQSAMALGGDASTSQSEALARDAVERAPRFALARAEYAVALVYRLLYRRHSGATLAEALSHASAAASLRPDLAIGHAAFGFALSALERFAEAKAAFGRALACDRHDPRINYLAARGLFAAGDHRGATALAERAAALDSDDIGASFLSAQAACVIDKVRGRRNTAICLRRAQSALTASPENPRARNVLAPLLAQMGEAEAAWRALESDERSGTAPEFYNVVALAALDAPNEAALRLESLADRGWDHPAWLRSSHLAEVLAGARGDGGHFARMAAA